MLFRLQKTYSPEHELLSASGKHHSLYWEEQYKNTSIENESAYQIIIKKVVEHA